MNALIMSARTASERYFISFVADPSLLFKTSSTIQILSRAQVRTTLILLLSLKNLSFHSSVSMIMAAIHDNKAEDFRVMSSFASHRQK
jgi:hypothetical protein